MRLPGGGAAPCGGAGRFERPISASRDVRSHRAQGRARARMYRSADRDEDVEARVQASDRDQGDGSAQRLADDRDAPERPQAACEVLRGPGRVAGEDVHGPAVAGPATCGRVQFWCSGRFGRPRTVSRWTATSKKKLDRRLTMLAAPSPLPRRSTISASVCATKVIAARAASPAPRTSAAWKRLTTSSPMLPSSRSARSKPKLSTAPSSSVSGGRRS
jgi:hypothetical protein